MAAVYAAACSDVHRLFPRCAWKRSVPTPLHSQARPGQYNGATCEGPSKYNRLQAMFFGMGVELEATQTIFNHWSYYMGQNSLARTPGLSLQSPAAKPRTTTFR
eukprot:11496879-Heterocapsa_arctica.AAC.1